MLSIRICIAFDLALWSWPFLASFFYPILWNWIYYFASLRFAGTRNTWVHGENFKYFFNL